MKFTDPFVPEPKKLPPRTSWWAEPSAQQHREVFRELAKSEEPRIVGNQRFGGSKKIVDKFPLSQKKSQR